MREASCWRCSRSTMPPRRRHRCMVRTPEHAAGGQHTLPDARGIVAWHAYAYRTWRETQAPVSALNSAGAPHIPCRVPQGWPCRRICHAACRGNKGTCTCPGRSKDDGIMASSTTLPSAPGAEAALPPRPHRSVARGPRLVHTAQRRARTVSCMPSNRPVQHSCSNNSASSTSGPRSVLEVYKAPWRGSAVPGEGYDTHSHRSLYEPWMHGVLPRMGQIGLGLAPDARWSPRRRGPSAAARPGLSAPRWVSGWLPCLHRARRRGREQ